MKVCKLLVLVFAVVVVLPASSEVVQQTGAADQSQTPAAPTGTQTAYSGVATLGAAWLGSQWSAGANIKGIQEKLADETATAAAFGGRPATGVSPFSSTIARMRPRTRFRMASGFTMQSVRSVMSTVPSRAARAPS